LENQPIITYLQIAELNSNNYTPRRIARMRWWVGNISNRLKEIILNVWKAFLETIIKAVKNCLII